MLILIYKKHNTCTCINNILGVYVYYFNYVKIRMIIQFCMKCMNENRNMVYVGLHIELVHVTIIDNDIVIIINNMIVVRHCNLFCSSLT